MSISNAINFLTKVESDDSFRRSCYSYKTHSELMEYLSAEGFSFSDLDMDNAVNHLLLRCDTESQAYNVRYLESWFSLFPRS